MLTPFLIILYNPLGVVFIHICRFLHDQNTPLSTLDSEHILSILGGMVRWHPPCLIAATLGMPHPILTTCVGTSHGTPFFAFRQSFLHLPLICFPLVGLRACTSPTNTSYTCCGEARNTSFDKMVIA